MKTKLFALVLLLGFAMLTTFSQGQTIKEEREIPTFTAIDLRIAGEVFIQQEATQKVIVEGDKSDIKDLITEVSGNELVIRFEGWKMRYGKIKLYISAKNFDDLDVSGSGSIVAQSLIITDDMDMDVSGSGKIKVENLETERIDISISGSGKVHLGGSKEANSMEFDISGSGDIYADKLPVKNVEGDISGSGKANVYATQTLEADISGSGRIYYKGNPQVDADISGSGSVRSSD